MIEERNARQRLVHNWVVSTFGPEHAGSLPQRATRFLEEAIELFQVCGGDKEMAHKLLDFVFAKDVGQLEKEIGDVGLTLLSVAAAAAVSADKAEMRVIGDALRRDPEEWRFRNLAKNAAGFRVEGGR